MASATLAAALKSGRATLLSAWADRVRRELAEGPLPAMELMDHMPAFIDGLIEEAAEPGAPSPSEPAEQHGIQRLRLGFDVGEVIREYGILQECVIEAMTGAGYTLAPDEQLLVARAITRGIADAASQYVAQRDAELQRQASEHMAFVAHELRNGLSTASISYEIVCRVAAEGNPALERLGRSLRTVTNLVNNTLTQSWLRMGVVPQAQRLPIRAFLEELVLDLAPGGGSRAIELALRLPADLVILADGRLLRSAVSNLLTNALKFSPPGSTVTLRASVAEGRLLIDVADQCGGLPPGRAEELFSPLVQKHENRTGFGLGLSIVQQAAEAHGGAAKVRDVSGVGCVFTLDLPLVPDASGSRQS